MFLPNTLPAHNTPLDPRDAETLNLTAADTVARFLEHRDNHVPTPLHALPALARELGIGALYVKDEGRRLGLGSFKALGGSYALIQLVLEQAARVLDRAVDIAELHSAEVRAIAARMTFACATDGNHGRSVAQGAQLVGANAAIFVHGGVSDARVAAIAHFGATMIRVDGSYDASVEEAAKVSAEKGWTVLSDTSWPGYERIPGLVMQGYSAIVRESLADLPEPPTHVFLQAGVGGFAAAVAGHMAVVLGDARPSAIVVDPARAACLFESAKAGHVVEVPEAEPTVMAMLECYTPSRVAWRVLERVSDGFMTVDEDEAPAAMRRLARPLAGDPPIVAGESGVAGLAGLVQAVANSKTAAEIGLGPNARVLIVNTEGATDPELYASLVGLTPEEVVGQSTGTGA